MKPLSILFVSVYVAASSAFAAIVSEPGLQAQRGPSHGLNDESDDGGGGRGPGGYIPQTSRPLGAKPSMDTMPDLAIDFSRLYWDKLEDGELWVQAESFKASFNTTGFAYVPFLGSGAPQNFPVGMRLQGAEAGSESLSLSDKATVWRAGDRVTLDRGSVRVHYDVGLQGIEQSFEFTQEELQGDLVLLIEVDTELEAAWSGGELSFGNNLGGVNYGKATAFDGSGSSLGLKTTFEDSHLKIVVPAAFVESAQGSILVDPIIGTYFLGGAANRSLMDPDVAYSYVNDAYCVAYTVGFSGNDYDVYTNVFDATNLRSRGIGTFLETGFVSWDSPSIAYQLDSDCFLTVCHMRGWGTGLARDKIVSRVRTAHNRTLRPVVTLDDHAVHADVGGDVYAGIASYFGVVYEKRIQDPGNAGWRSEIRWVRVRANGTIVGDSRVLVGEQGSSFRNPCISKSTGLLANRPRFNVAWYAHRRAGTSLQGRSVEAIQLDFRGTPQGTIFSAIPSPELAGLQFDISELLVEEHGNTGDSYYVITQGSASGGFIGSYQGPASVTLCAGSQVLDHAPLERLEHRTMDPNLVYATSIATGSDHWMVSYLVRTLRTNNVRRTLNTLVLQPVKGKLGLSEVPYQSGELTTENNPAKLPFGTCSTTSGGAPASLYGAGLLAFSDRTNGYGANSLRAARLGVWPSNAVGYQYCSSPANGTGEPGLLIATGRDGTVATKGLIAHRLPPNRFAMLMVSASPGFYAGYQGGNGNLCLGGAHSHYNQSHEIKNTGSAGIAYFNMDPTRIRSGGQHIPAYAGQTFYFQVWYADFGQTNLTNGVGIPF